MTHQILRRVLPAMAVSALGDGMSAVAVALLAVRLAGLEPAGILVGGAVAAYTLPGAAGAVLLARPLRRLSSARLITADAALRTAALGAIPVLYALGRLTGPWYVALLALSSILHAWGISGRYTLLAEHLPQTQRLAGNALLSIIDQSAIIGGAVLAGLVISVSNPSLAIAADAVSFALLAIVTSASGQSMVVERTGSNEPASVRAAGFRFIVQTPALLGLLALTVVFFFLYGPVEVALPLYVVGPLHGSAALLALFWAVFGAAAVIGSTVTGLLRRLPLWPTAITAVIGWGVALLPIGLLQSAPPALACFAVAGFVYAPYGALSYTLFQTVSPPRLLSQVIAARGALTILAAPMGTALGGPLVVAIGARGTLFASATATIVLGFVAIVCLQYMRRRYSTGASYFPLKER